MWINFFKKESKKVSNISLIGEDEVSMKNLYPI